MGKHAALSIRGARALGWMRSELALLPYSSALAAGSAASSAGPCEIKCI